MAQSFLADHGRIGRGQHREQAGRQTGTLGEVGDRQRRERGLGAGFDTMAQPTASAGATFRASMAFGKFHGVIAPTTPTGCLMTMIRLSA